MMNNNKILTVSYGTFSCTLEGFEDSFDTMKAIAEYFRDLAADDRYFGAEPPQPDVEMLARIAEREVERRVEARLSDTGIHLRTQQAGVAAVTAGTLLATQADEPDEQAPAQTEVAAAEPAPLPTPPVDIPKPPTDVPTPPADAAAMVDEDPVAEAPTQELDEADASADLISAVVQETAPQTEDAVDAVSEAIADTLVEPEMDAPDTPILQASMGHLMPDMDPALPTQPQAAFDANQDMDTAEEVVAPAPEPNSIADKLARIRDVVAKNQSFPSGYSEDQHAEEFMKGAEDSEDESLLEDDALDGMSLEDVMAEAEAEDSVSEDDAQDAAETSIKDVMASFSTPEEPEVEDLAAEQDATAETVAALAQTWDELEEDMAEEVDEDDSLFAETLAEIESLSDEDDVEPESLFEDEDDAEADDLSAEIMRLTDEYEVEDEDALSADDEETDEETFETQGGIAEELTLDDADFAGLLDDGVSLDEANDDPETDGLYVEDTSTTVRRVRVIKVKREDVDAALNDGSLEEVDSEDTDTESSLSLSDEEELLRELAQVEAELESEHMAGNEAAHDDPVDVETAEDASAARLLQEAAGAEEDELDRLMAEADSQMDEPEGTSRRSAFSHLRAAVAATKADDKLSEAADGPKDDEYRTDLAAAVKPRRPVKNAEMRKDRPRNERPAPLKLVAEQRIDVPETNAGPVRPRRVSAEAQSVQDDNGSFADYAESCGAHDLSEVLEAAASYLSFVEGKEQFSRPQLMTKVRQLGLEGFTREDGLRHFGQLLRAGKIEKIKGGRFTVSDDIGFRPDDHRQAG